MFDSRPHMTTAKALMINTAYQYPIGTQQQQDFTRFNQGWGMPDVKNLYNLREKLFIIDETDILTEMESISYTVKIDAGEPALRVTLVYADPPGNPAANQAAINNLSLQVCAPVAVGEAPCSGTIYWGNCGLMDENWSSTGCAEDHPYPGSPTLEVIDTVENVFIQNPISGDWTVEVTATEICEDGHVLYLNNDPTECCQFLGEFFDPCEEPDAPSQCIVSSPVDADFALVVSGVSEKKACCLPLFSCVNHRRGKCQQLGGVFHCDTWCPTICEWTQGPSQGP